MKIFDWLSSRTLTRSPSAYFSWSTLEPREGEFHFDWLDKILDRMAKQNMAAVLATPSGARPAWLSFKYPQVLRMTKDGHRNHHEGRHNHCFTSPIYREKSLDD